MYDSEEYSEAFEDLASPFVQSRAARRCKCRSRGKRGVDAPKPQGAEGTTGAEGSEETWSGEDEMYPGSGEAQPEVELDAQYGEYEDEGRGVGEFEDAETEYEDEEVEAEALPADFQARLAAVAAQEWQRWGQGTKVESDSDMAPRLRVYWAAAGFGPADIAQAIRKNWHWSAAFVSYLMQAAGAGKAFKGQSAHRLYIKAAKGARAAGDSSKFQAYRINEIAPQVGDIVCRDRSENKRCAGTNYDNVDDGTERAAHCEVVIAVGQNAITTIGGNTSGPRCRSSGCTVNERSVRIDKQGRVVSGPGACQFFAMLKAPGRAAPVAKAPPIVAAVRRPAPTSPATFLKDVAELKTAVLAPASPIGIDRKWPEARRRAASTYNRVGGLMSAVATRLSVDVASVLAVWLVESGGRTHTPGKAIIRFENHLLYRLWGERNQPRYNTHFRHGGHAGQAGKSWEGHQFRASAADQFMPIHTGGQANEYRALELATRLAGEDVALRCISIGGPQILIENRGRLGYATSRQMYDAFQASERWQVIGFFDFCRRTKQGQLVAFLRARDWQKFAYYYNGKGQVAKYGGHLTDAYQAAQAIAVGAFAELQYIGLRKSGGTVTA